MPFRPALFSQNSHMQRRRIEKANSPLFSERRELMIHVVYQQIVAAVVQNGIDGNCLRDADQKARRVARDSNVTNSFLPPAVCASRVWSLQ